MEVILKNTQDLQGVTLDGGLRHSDLSYLIPSQLRGIVLGSGIFQQSRSPITITDSIVNELGL